LPIELVRTIRDEIKQRTEELIDREKAQQGDTGQMLATFFGLDLFTQQLVPRENC
jgi:hypothetical protein